MAAIIAPRLVRKLDEAASTICFCVALGIAVSFKMSVTSATNEAFEVASLITPS
jgi:hypothetical protein